MNLLTEKILLTIKENYIEAINKLSKESFDVYGFINDEFKNTEDITKNHLFQFVFRSFYRLDNAGLVAMNQSVGNAVYFKDIQSLQNIGIATVGSIALYEMILNARGFSVIK